MLAALSCLINCNRLFGQKGDYNWLSGYDSQYSFGTGGNLFGNTVMNFNESPVNITFDSLQMNFDKTNTGYSDSNGILLFYTNGIYIANSFNEPIENSDSLNAGFEQYNWDPSIQNDGYRNTQGILALQSIVNANNYILIYSFNDSVPGTGGGNLYTSNIFSALLDISANNGHGLVLSKNKSIINDSLGSEFTATKHGNGRDWWLLFQKRNTNCYYRILIDTGGIKVMPELICGGLVSAFDDIGATCFSPDGSKFVYFNFFTGISIFDFDRCTGFFSSSITVPTTILYDSSWSGMGAAISPNNRFLYVTATKQVYQFDLMASDITASIDTVARFDNYQAPFGTYFNTAQLGPDGKIYISCGNADSVYHVINNPDAKGANCDFVQHGVHLPSASWGVPNFPNYRLGALTQSQCDSLSTFTQDIRDSKERILKIFPNPAGDMTTIDYGFTDWNNGPISLEITNQLGQVVYSQSLPNYSGYQRVDITALATGAYEVFIKRNGGIVATKQLAVVR